MTKRKSSKKVVSQDVAEKARATAPQPTLQDLIAALGGVTHRPNTSQMSVGIRNVCGNSLGVEPFGNEPGFQLHPFSPTNPNSMAVVSWPRWQALRKGTLYNQGMIERFDEILDSTVTRGPADQPHECAPDHEKNKIVDPHQWITSKTDEQLRKAVLAITSESQLHRILATVDEKLKELETEIRASGEVVPNTAERAIEELPVIYQLAEKFAQWRLNQIVRGADLDGMLPKKSDMKYYKE